MIKRASTILLTLFFLLTSAQVWGATNMTSSTTFQKEDGVTGTNYTLNDIKITSPFISSISTTCKYDTNASGSLNKYKVTSAGAQFSYSSSSTTQSTFVNINFENLKKGTSYTFEIKLNINGSTHDGLQLKYGLNGGTVTNISTTGDAQKGNSLEDKWFKVTKCNSDATFKYTFTANSNSATYSLQWDWTGKSINYALIKSASITGAVEPTIISSTRNSDIPKGSSCTFEAIGLQDPITWSIKLDNKPEQVLGTGSTWTLDNVSENGIIYAKGNGNTPPLQFPFRAVISCSDHAIKQDVVTITFEMPTGVNQCSLMDIQDEDVASGRVDLSTTYCYGRHDNTCACTTGNAGTSVFGGSGPEEEHYVIAKTTLDMFSGWYNNGQGVVGKSNNGFMIVNCGLKMNDIDALEQGRVTEDGMICDFTAKGLCTDTWYDFSVAVRDINLNGEATADPTNVRFVAVGVQTGEILMNYPTGVIGKEDWVDKSHSFNTEGNNEVRLILYNNQPTSRTTCPISGSDLGVDDIKFTRCIPRLGTYSNEDRTQKGYDICNRDNGVTVSLFAGHPSFGITDMIGTPWYIFFKSVDDGNWEQITTPEKIEDRGYAQTTNTVLQASNRTIKYTSIVAGSEEAANIMKDFLITKTPANYETDISSFRMPTTINNYGCTLYAFGENVLEFPIDCAVCTDSKAPTIESYNACPTSETIDLFSLVKTITKADNTPVDISSATDKKAAVEAIGTITWYKKDGSNYIPLEENESVINMPEPGTEEIYAAKFKQNDEGSVAYCISDYSADFTIKPKQTIVPTMNTEIISGCLQNLSSDEDRTFKVESLNLNVAATYIWKTVNADNTETEIPGATASSYVLPEDDGFGTIMLYITSTTACPSIGKKLTYNIADNPEFTIESMLVPCKDQIKDEGIKIKLTNIGGSSKLKITRNTVDGNGEKNITFVSFDSDNADWIKNISYAGEEEFTFIDKYFENDVIDIETFSTVKYTITLGVEEDNCFQSTNTETKNITSTNDLPLIANATNIKQEEETPEYHVCIGNSVTVNTSYELQPGEYFEWWINGVKDGSEESKQDQNYTIEEMEVETKFSIYLKGETGVQTCGGENHLTVYVDQKPSITKEDKDICKGDKDTQLNVTGGDSYKWTPSSTLNDGGIGNPIANVEDKTTYTVEVGNGVCLETTTVTITVHPQPVIVSINPESEESKNNIVVLLEEEIGNSYYYSLDGTDYTDFPIDNIINSVPIGWSLLYIKDNNKCVSTKEFYIEPVQIIPDKFFTPNGEGDERHERWQIENLDSYDSYIVEIFDRHGKRLFIQRVGSFNTGGTNTVDGDEFEGWNGEYNGKPMPSDDYWYLITVEDIRKQYTGHFTLKR